MELGGLTRHVTDVGRILLQVQRELKDLRESVAAPGAQGGLSSAELEEVIQRAEADLRAKAEVVLNTMVNDNVRTSAAVERELPKPGARVGGRPPPQQPTRVRERIEAAREAHFVNNPASERGREFLRDRFGIPFTPERERESRPMGKRQVGIDPAGGRRFGAKTVAAQKLLPRLNRMDPHAPPPPITAAEAEAGVLNLINRGFIPSGVDLTAAFAQGAGVMKARAAPFHNWTEQHVKPATYVQPTSFNIAQVRLAPSDAQQVMLRHRQVAQQPAGGVGGSPERQQTEVHRPENVWDEDSVEFPAESPTGEEEVEQKPDDALAASVDKIRGYNELLDTFSLHQFIIRNGRALDNTPEFASYQRTNADIWGSVTGVIRALEALLRRYAVPLAYVDGQAVVRLAVDELQANTPEALVGCIANFDQVRGLLRVPGQRFRGEDGREEAAVLLQSVFRMYQTRKLYIHRQTEAEAAAVIQSRWRVHHRQLKMYEELRLLRSDEDEYWREQAEEFRRDWDQIKGRRRVAIHLPSLTLEEAHRFGMPHFQAKQNLQMARLCALADPLVDVVYISPFPLPSDVRSYYEKLLEIGGVTDARVRLKVIVPENVDRFPQHFSLASLLLYSPHSLRRLRNLVRNKTAYLVPSIMGPHEKRISQIVGVPLLAPPPEVSDLYSTKSGAKRLFAAADMNIPLGAHDIFDEAELMAAMTRLIAANPEIERWVIRIDDDGLGTGVAYYDASLIRGMKEIRREKYRFCTNADDPGYWVRPDVQEGVRRKVHEGLVLTLSRAAVMAHPECYEDWDAFMYSFQRVGGVVEAVPDDVRGWPAVHLFIEPSGPIHITSTHDMLLTQPYHALGAAFPQLCVPHEALQGASNAIGAELYARGVIGYVSISYCTFWDSVHASQKLWATDLQLGLTDTAASFVLFNFIMGGQFDPFLGHYLVPEDQGRPSSAASSASGTSVGSGAALASARSSDWSQMGGEPESPRSPGGAGGGGSGGSGGASGNVVARSYVSFPFIYNPNLATIQYQALFNLCRLKGVSFDLRAKVGTCFQLVDSLAGGVLGVLAVGANHADAVVNMSACFDFVEEQVGSRTVKSEFREEDGNFKEIHNMLHKAKKAVLTKRR